jgi:hypothetical protein
MTQRFFIDPPSGWRYGFPKIWDPVDGPVEEWLLAEGYPQKDIEFACKHLRAWLAADAVVKTWDELEQKYQAGCDHCNHPLYAGIKCGTCGRWTEI